MVDVVARIKIKGKNFEIIVDCDKALALKKQGKIAANMLRDVLAIDLVYTDYKKGFKASMNDLKEAFGTDNIYEVAAKILMNGEILLPQEYRDKAREQKIKQVIDFLARNCMDPRTGAPYTAERISAAMKQINARVDENKSVEDNALLITRELEKILPIKISMKKIKIVIPPAYTANAYNLLKNFAKEKEEWLADGSLSCIINIPAGMQLEFYNKLNSITRGSAITEEIKEE